MRKERCLRGVACRPTSNIVHGWKVVDAFCRWVKVQA